MFGIALWMFDNSLSGVRGQPREWSTGLIWLQDVSAPLPFFLLAVLLLILTRRVRPVTKVFSFGIVISLVCGIGHSIAALTIVYPLCRQEEASTALSTVVLSSGTLALVPALSRMMIRQAGSLPC